MPVPPEGRGARCQLELSPESCQNSGYCTTLGRSGESGMTWQDPGLSFWQVSDALTQKSQSGACNPSQALNRHTQTAKHRGRSRESHADGLCNNAF